MTAPYALVIGEALIDLIESSDPAGELVYRPRYGGSPLNVAVGVRRLGVPTTFAGAFGKDVFGHRLRDFLLDQGIRIAGPMDSGMGTVLGIAMSEAGHVQFEFVGDFASLTEIPPIDPALVADAAVVHAGSTVFNADPAYGTAVSAYRCARGFRTIDPNPRPFLIGDRGTYLSRLEAAMALVDLIKLSADDTGFLYPGLGRAEAAHRARAIGARATVIVTCANEDTLVLYQDVLLTIPVPTIDPIDCTGAGDSFMASVLAAIVTEGPPSSMEAWSALVWAANAAAAVTCSTVGGAAAMPTSDKVLARLELLGRTGVTAAPTTQ